jgi:uncharacterized protein (TIGR00369 family)
MTEASQVLRERIKSSFDAQGLMALLGARLGEVTPGRVQVILPARPEVSQQLGYIHAGATSAIADTAGGFAALTMFDASSEILTVEYKINLLNPGRGGAADLDQGRQPSPVRLVRPARHLPRHFR